MNKFSFKGKRKKNNYFEGWYLKVVDKEQNISLAVIFGLSLNKKDPHSFIQIINNINNDSKYLRFSVKDFNYKKNTIRIKNNVLKPNRLIIKTNDIKIKINISDFSFLPKKFLNSSIMGYFKYFSLPTYHEIIYLGSYAKGTILTNEKIYNIEGKAYMEKDWGTKFPNKWLWIQTNDFTKTNSQLVIAIADILFKFKGFFCILVVNNKPYLLATYNGAKVDFINDNNKTTIKVIKGKLELRIILNYKNNLSLIAPLNNGLMKRKIKESIDSTLEIKLYQNNKLIIEDRATNVGCENLYKK